MSSNQENPDLPYATLNSPVSNQTADIRENIDERFDFLVDDIKGFFIRELGFSETPLRSDTRWIGLFRNLETMHAKNTLPPDLDIRMGSGNRWNRYQALMESLEQLEAYKEELARRDQPDLREEDLVRSASKAFDTFGSNVPTDPRPAYETYKTPFHAPTPSWPTWAGMQQREFRGQTTRTPFPELTLPV